MHADERLTHYPVACQCEFGIRPDNDLSFLRASIEVISNPPSGVILNYPRVDKSEKIIPLF
jgi:hypothetical protein